MGRMEKKETSKTRAQQRAAGTKKTALFDMVNRNDAATRLVSAERAKRRAVEARCLYAASRNVTRARSALSLRRRHAGKFTQPAQAWLRCRRLEGEGGHQSWVCAPHASRRRARKSGLPDLRL